MLRKQFFFSLGFGCSAGCGLFGLLRLYLDLDRSLQTAILWIVISLFSFADNLGLLLLFKMTRETKISIAVTDEQTIIPKGIQLTGNTMHYVTLEEWRVPAYRRWLWRWLGVPLPRVARVKSKLIGG
jgi:hypothetical protein